MFDEDAILLSFFSRYTEPDEENDLRNAIIKYVGGNVTEDGVGEESTKNSSETIDDISSPMDSGIGMKKRMAGLKQK